MERKDTRLIVDIGGVPTDLHSGMLDALEHPPAGFASKHPFTVTDLPARLRATPWFQKVGTDLALDLTMPFELVGSWTEAQKASQDPAWENAILEAQNQLTVWLARNCPDRYQDWNAIVARHKTEVIDPLTSGAFAPCEAEHRLHPSVMHSVRWTVLGAVMENAYLPCGHRAFFFLELLTVYERGHIPCGWRGTWPAGSLVIY